MSYCKQIGKDRILFATEEDLEKPSSVSKITPDTEDLEGLVTPDGDINWNCPCLHGMADGPCGESFKAAFSCFFYSETDPKGSDCVDKFKLFSQCTMNHSESNESNDANTKSSESAHSS